MQLQASLSFGFLLCHLDCAGIFVVSHDWAYYILVFPLNLYLLRIY